MAETIKIDFNDFVRGFSKKLKDDPVNLSLLLTLKKLGIKDLPLKTSGLSGKFINTKSGIEMRFEKNYEISRNK